ncbi:MAG: fluoride efflux transporter FluC, partial [Gemmatimonadaceae bacterium]
LGGVVQRASAAAFPVGTLAVNVIGCFLIGVLVQHYMHVQTSPVMRAALITGFCGGFTTFSAFGIETAGLIEGGAYGKAAAYIVMSISLSILATFGGMAASKAVTA